MKSWLFSTQLDWVGLVLRFTIAFVLFPHGAQKLLGLYGGFGFKGTMQYFTQTAGLPWIIAFLVIIIEFFGPISLLLGFASRIWAALIIVLMIGIITTSHLQHGFFMNWLGNQQGEGYEFHLLMIGLALALLLNGSGRFSADGMIGG